MYNIKARRMISGLVLKYLKEASLVIPNELCNRPAPLKPSFSDKTHPKLIWSDTARFTSQKVQNRWRAIDAID